MGAAVGGGQGGGEEEETRQAKEMAAARRRWETLVSSLHLSYSLSRGFLAKQSLNLQLLEACSYSYGDEHHQYLVTPEWRILPIVTLFKS
jgi:hypothetical protein